MKTDIVVIPDYSADDFYSTSEPYELLYSHRDDKFLMQQLIQKMKEKAGAVGVRSFMALWNAYCETIQQQNGVITDRATDFEGQDVELLSGEYVCNDDGVFLMDKFGYKITVCCHPILPVMRLVNADTQEERLKIAYKKGKTWRYIISEKSIIASNTQILQLAAQGIVVTSENAKILSTYLLDIEQLNYDLIPEENSISRLGWINGHGFSPYVDNLVFDGETSFRTMFEAISCKGSYDEWIDAMNKLRREKTVARIALAAAFASVLVEPCGCLPFFCHFWGESGTGKSVMLRIAASVWGDSRMGALISTFNSTDVGQEMTAAFFNSLPVCIDELQIQAASGVKDFDKIIYKLAEGIGKTRGTKNGGIKKTSTWRNCFITTGEYPIINSNSMGGATVRVLEIETEGKIYSDLTELCSVLDKNYGYAGKHFVELLREDGAIRQISELQKSYFRELLKYDSTEKQAASASLILTADYLISKLIFDGEESALTVKDLAKILTKKDEANANKKAYDYIMDVVAANPNRFKPNDFGDYQGEVWGKLDGNEIYIIKSIFDRELSAAGYSASAFLSWAKKKDLIICDEGRRTKNVRLLSSVVNCVCVVRNSENKAVYTSNSINIVNELRTKPPLKELKNDEDLPF